ncbi:MAG: antibiotic biosynthesis monooxygenase [Planctomycetes bacterium]|nr:antibiotic biosynthesis monooxygenase [Planctomycetota bacterium]
MVDTPDGAYYAVIFSAKRTNRDEPQYDEMVQRMLALATQQPGFIGFESTHGAEGFEITVSYWRDIPSIRGWRQHADHLVAQAKGRSTWYERYRVRVCRVEQTYGFQGL